MKIVCVSSFADGGIPYLIVGDGEEGGDGVGV